jgi:hypothetical protein
MSTNSDTYRWQLNDTQYTHYKRSTSSDDWHRTILSDRYEHMTRTICLQYVYSRTNGSIFIMLHTTLFFDTQMSIHTRPMGICCPSHVHHRFIHDDSPTSYHHAFFFFSTLLNFAFVVSCPFVLECFVHKQCWCLLNMIYRKLWKPTVMISIHTHLETLLSTL